MLPSLLPWQPCFCMPKKERIKVCMWPFDLYLSFFYSTETVCGEILMAEVLFICPQVWFSCHDIVRSWRSSYRNRIQSTAPTGHVKDILKEWRSPALYLPMLTVHAGPTAIHPRSSQYCFLVDGCINEFRESDSRQP